MAITAMLSSPERAVTLIVVIACDWSLAAPSAVSHSEKRAWSSAEETTIQETRIIISKERASSTVSHLQAG